jgi:hypothetical protein
MEPASEIRGETPSVIHFATVHYLSPMWIDVQLREIARNTPDTTRVWACLNGIDPSYDSRFHVAIDLEGKHGEKLNALAEMILDEASDDDLIVFIDGDAFPLPGWTDRVREHLPAYPLVAVRRDENLGDIQPHPCFAVSTVGFWRTFRGDWSWGGKTWVNSVGIERQDAGGRVLAKLEEERIPWYPLLRSNRTNLHRILFGVYGDAVYHHGAGFRGASSSIDRFETGVLTSTSRIKSLIAKQRLKPRLRRNLRQSEEVFQGITTDVDYVQRTFLQ